MLFVERIPHIQDVKLHEGVPCDNIAITSWEQRYSTVLPHEIKDFFLATDGFKLTWNYNYAGEFNYNVSFWLSSVGFLHRKQKS